MNTQTLRRKMHARLYILCASFLLLAGGLLYLLLPLWQEADKRREGESLNRARLQQQIRSGTTFTEPELDLGTPVKLRLQRLDMTLPIKPGKYYSGSQQWLLDRQHVFYLTPGEFPLSADAHPLFYGHNIPEVLRPLGGVAADELLEIRTTDSRVLLFRYISDQTVNPTEGNTLNEVHGDNTIAVLTCSGSRFEKRRILYFDYVGTRIIREAVRL